MADLPDVNVWVALSVPEHPFHASATKYWNEQASSSLAFCRITALGLARVCTQRNTLGGVPLDVQTAWAVLNGWQRHPGVSLLQEPPGIDSLLHRWIVDDLVTSRTWTDAYLAAFALGGKLRLVSFDNDFSRFPGLDYLLLPAQLPL